MKLRMKLKNGSHRYDIDRPRPRHGQRYTEYKMCLIIHGKVKKNWGWVGKKRV